MQLNDIRDAAKLLEGVILRTPLEPSWALSEQAGGSTHLKCENLQRTGAFKIRGAYNFISRLPDDQKREGVVAASAGNHGQGVALAASLLGVKATVFMPIGASLPKIEAATHYGADVILEGSVWDDSQAAAVEFSKEKGAVLVHPFDHPDVIAGQGTVGLEVIDQLPNVSTIVVPVGGGGLVSGIAAAAKGLSSEIRVIGVEPEGAATVANSLEFGRLVTLDRLSTVADGLAAKRSGPIAFAHVQQLVDEVVLVSDDEIAQALLLIAERAKLVVEPGGAAAVAALMTRKAKIEFPAVAILSGGNVDPMLLMQVVRFGMSSAGRYFSFRTRLT
ncbi:MAG: threonine ammonia-lyase, partial [Acidimicrobiia bacterium]